MRLLLVLLLLLAPQAGFAKCYEDEVRIRGDFGEARFRIEVADTFEERAQGLMFVEEMPASVGMLFVYQEAGTPTFWMKNTLIPLDMIFVRPDGTIQHVHENAIPGDLTGISGGPGVSAVLEINGGLARAMGIEPGAEMQHPSFGEAAIWPCE